MIAPRIFTSRDALRGAHGDGEFATPRQVHDLVASVEHHMDRADIAEQERDALRARVAALESALAASRAIARRVTAEREAATDAALAAIAAMRDGDPACAAIDGDDGAGPTDVDATGRGVTP